MAGIPLRELASERRKEGMSDYAQMISASGLSIYDDIEVGDSTLWIPTRELEELLDGALCGTSLGDLPLRTRSKVVKSLIARALGYPVPKSFKKTQPRFPGQRFDTYVQKANNVQIWNEQISPDRRYVLIRISQDHVITRVKVVTGDDLAKFDTTGTLTQKYQARLIPGVNTTELVSSTDTDRLPITGAQTSLAEADSPVAEPSADKVLPIAEVCKRLSSLVGTYLSDRGYDQERNRAAALHAAVCEALGYSHYHDDGRFPDIRHQLLEVKLQTSPTIDLGLVRPDNTEPMDAPHLFGYAIRHCDVRYAIFYGATDGQHVRITNLYVVTGERFFDRFEQFGGRVLNKKLQIPLPQDFFDR